MKVQLTTQRNKFSLQSHEYQFTVLIETVGLF